MRSRSAASVGALRRRGQLGEHGARQRPGGEEQDRDDAADDDAHEAEQLGAELESTLATAGDEQRREDGHEGGAQGGVGEQLLDEVRDDAHRDQRVVRRVDAVHGGDQHLAAQPGDARQPGRRGHDDRRPRELSRPLAHAPLIRPRAANHCRRRAQRPRAAARRAPAPQSSRAPEGVGSPPRRAALPPPAYAPREHFGYNCRQKYDRRRRGGSSPPSVVRACPQPAARAPSKQAGS